MFEALELLPARRKEISLATRQGTAIKNEVLPAISDYERNHYKRFRSDHATTSWVHRKDACGGYNCFGHVFATRRTALIEEHASQIPMILKEDGYFHIPNRSDARPGDIALYFDRNSKEYLHVGQVVDVSGVQNASGGSAFGSSVRVLSKWGPVEGEDIHHIEHVPYRKLGFDIDILIMREGS